ncbi:MAG: RHS repeat-associated core domain-containing protein [Bacteroidales bacterium]|nr:RHS repeat-associated core domain-containing protein [Bacteroidales bacterium]
MPRPQPYRPPLRQPPAPLIRVDTCDTRRCAFRETYTAATQHLRGRRWLHASTTDHRSLFTAHWTYTFSAKERDPETGLSYFGSRYYSSDLSIWLSVDPMASKYPSLSPYVYCANNPVKLVDPNGEKIWIHDEEGGSAANAYYQELVKWASSENINLSLGNDGYLNASFDGEYSDLSDEAQNFLHAVYNPNITVDIMATTDDYGDNDYAFFCGTYKGVVYGYSKGEEVAHSYQVVNPNDLRQFDEYHQQPGQTSLHELMESYNAALMSISNCSSDNEGKRKYYKSSHQNAPPQSGTFKKYYAKNGHILRKKLPSHKIQTSKWFIYYSSESGDKIFKKVPITNH